MQEGSRGETIQLCSSRAEGLCSRLGRKKGRNAPDLAYGAKSLTAVLLRGTLCRCNVDRGSGS